MKRGFFPKLAWDAMRKNKRMYFPYVLVGSVMVMMYYILISMVESPSLEDIHGGSFLMEVLPMGCAVIAIFSLLFLFYTHSFLIKQRAGEFGLYNILGMDKRNLCRVMVWETLYTAVCSIGFGLAAGVALSKAAELLVLNILNAEISFSFHIGVTSMLMTALIYGGIYVVLLLNALIKVFRSKPLELMRSSRVGEKRLKCNWLFAAVGVVLLGGAYVLAVRIEEPVTALFMFFVAVVMVIVGTYLLFISGSVAFCRLLQKNKRYYYKANHFVSVSSMAYRMKRNGAGLASICILLTMVLVMLSSSATLYFSKEDSIQNRYPNGINIRINYASIDGLEDESLNELRTQIAQYAPEGADLTGTRYALSAGLFTEDGIIIDYTHVSSFDYDQVGYLYVISIEDYNRMMNANRSLADDECFLYCDRLMTQWSTFTMEYGKSYRVAERLTEFREDGKALAMTMPSVYIVVNDVYAFVEPVIGLKNDSDYFMVDFEWLCGFDCTSAEEELQVKDALFDALSTSMANRESSIRYLIMESREEERFSFYEMYGSLFFLGIMLSMVFVIAAVLIIYYKQISEGYEDQNRFEIMQKVGMTKKDIRKSVNSQMLSVFFLPLATAGMHLGFAFPFISKILVMFAFDNLWLNLSINLICFAVFGAFYAVVYKITSSAYYTIVSKSDR